MSSIDPLREPEPYVERWYLPDRTPVTIRTARGEDEPALGRLVLDLTPHDRRWRFHGGIAGAGPSPRGPHTGGERPPATGLVAIAHLRDGDRLIADARWAADEHGPQGEGALMVAAPWRRQGVATRLLIGLQRTAFDAGLRILRGSVMVENTPMLSLLVRCGIDHEPDRGDPDLRQVRIRLDRSDHPLQVLFRPGLLRRLQRLATRRAAGACRAGPSSERSSRSVVRP